VTKTPARPRIIIGDDNESVQAGISRMLSASCDVVGCAADTVTLFEAASRLRPDVVLLDFSLPGNVNALQVCRHIKATAPEVSVVAFTAHDDMDIRRAAHEAGAAAFVSKMHAASELLPTIQALVHRTNPSD
jgi:DNA-binding NarL/FixJ family response regulator